MLILARHPWGAARLKSAAAIRGLCSTSKSANRDIRPRLLFADSKKNFFNGDLVVVPNGERF